MSKKLFEVIWALWHGTLSCLKYSLMSKGLVGQVERFHSVWHSKKLPIHLPYLPGFSSAQQWIRTLFSPPMQHLKSSDSLPKMQIPSWCIMAALKLSVVCFKFTSTIWRKWRGQKAVDCATLFGTVFTLLKYKLVHLLFNFRFHPWFNVIIATKETCLYTTLVLTWALSSIITF